MRTDDSTAYKLARHALTACPSEHKVMNMWGILGLEFMHRSMVSDLLAPLRADLSEDPNRSLRHDACHSKSLRTGASRQCELEAGAQNACSREGCAAAQAVCQAIPGKLLAKAVLWLWGGILGPLAHAFTHDPCVSAANNYWPDALQSASKQAAPSQPPVWESHTAEYDV